MKKEYVAPSMEIDEIKNDAIRAFCLHSDNPSCPGNFSGCTESITSCSGDTGGAH